MRDLFYQILSLFYPIIDTFYSRRLRVLAYHDIVDNNTFDQQIRFLSSRYNILTIDELFNFIQNHNTPPKRSLLITFDDGDISVLEKGLPILKKYNSPACVFIITELIGKDKAPWFTAIRQSLKKKGYSKYEIEIEMQSLKKLKNSAREFSVKKYSVLTKRQLHVEDLFKLEGFQVRIGNHSHSHPMFNKCSTEELKNELQEVDKLFEKWGLDGCKYFAYPNGNWDKNSEKILKKEGIKLAFLFDHKINQKTINPLRISRIRANSEISVAELKVKVSGLHSILQHRKL